uniref:Uncharacterized protein n=1 Tax=Quercus lobata TaxID=97700 RepID=A0A7N2M0E8_QUELO
MAVPVEEAIAALSTFSLEDEQPEVQGPGLWVSTERGATESPIGMNSLEQFCGSELGVHESAMELPPIVSQGTMVADVASSSNSRMTMFRTKFGFFTGRNLVACTLRRWSNGEDDGSNSNL